MGYDPPSPTRRFLSVTRDLFFPPRCAACGELLPPFVCPPAVLCPACREAWNASRADAAAAAGEAIDHGHVYLVGYRSGRTDGVPERFIFHLKHAGDRRSFDFAAEALAFSVQTALSSHRQKGSQPPLFTFPPRRRAAIHADGFDQAARLSRALSRVCGGEYAALLKRTGRHTEEQKTLHADERNDNAARSYALRRHAAKQIRGRVVVLCDDLATTGATLSRCESLLKEAGAVAIVWATVARTQS